MRILDSVLKNLIEIEFCRWIFEKERNINLHEDPSARRRIFTFGGIDRQTDRLTDRQTDRHSYTRDGANSRFFEFCEPA
jgi:hypothetical protein